MSIDDEWSNFINMSVNDVNKYNNSNINNDTNINYRDDSSIDYIPTSSDIYISTKTKIVYLNNNLNIYDIFWKIPIINYDEQKEGIIKKQIKLSCLDKIELENINKLLDNEVCVTNKIINHIDNPNGRIKFKHIRKISIGICKKDLIYTRTKEKSAFYNCFVLTFRINYQNNFKEIHVKVFNTGKLEIPGLQNDTVLNIVLIKITEILKNITNKDIFYFKDKTENVLINSNFNCGFYINREKLFTILRYKYNINASYDPCSYPGIQCIYYYDNKNNISISETLNIDANNNTDILKISYMIFRTGSILIVGKCDEIILNLAYNYIKDLLYNEYTNIKICNIDTKIIKKSNKLRKRIIYKTL